MARRRVAPGMQQRRAAMAEAQPQRLRGLNENYARELMELHTLGVDGGYTQRDVTELARMLTGWGIDARAGKGDVFEFDARRHDRGTKTWLGQTVAPAGQAEGERALDVLAAHPSTARHLAFKFAQAFVRRGLHPDWGGTYFLPRIVGVAKACELIFTGDTLDAAEALRLGIVNAVVEPEALMPKTYELARKIAAGPPIAIRLAKRAIYHNQDVDLRAALEYETYAQNLCRETEDAKEGVKAFVEKRAPSFRGV